MKRSYIFLIVAALCAIGVSAKTIHIWRNGIKTDLPIQTNDSITFDKQNAPTMTIWRNDSAIYQLALAVDDSITYSPDSTVTPPATICFDYDHWRDVDTIHIYTSKWDSIYLPWAKKAETTMPTLYCTPNTEDKWELAFNTCSDPYLQDLNMFGLWDKNTSTMRIYVYIAEATQGASYCYFIVQSDSTTFIEPDAKMWMPSDSIIKKVKWNPQAFDTAAVVPSDKWCQVMPITGTLTGQVNKGWLCFELNFSAGNFTVPLDSRIDFYLTGVEEMDFSGDITIDEFLKTDSSFLTIPGNKWRKTSAILKAGSTLVSGIGSGLTSGFGTGATTPQVVGGFAQCIGAVGSFIGDCIDAAHADDTVNYALNMNIHATGTDHFEGTLTSTHPTTLPSFSATYGALFEEIIKHQNVQRASDEHVTIGTWNLKNQPVLYVCGDACLSTGLYTVDCLYASFLAPSSIEIQLNSDSLLFDVNNIDSVSVLAYDFAFISDKYTIDNLPYYNFYGIHHDPIQLDHVISVNGDEAYKNFLLDPTAEYQTFNTGAFGYNTYNTCTGVTSQLSDEYGMDAYNVVYTPIFGERMDDIVLSASGAKKKTNSDPGSYIYHRVGVSVLLEIKFKNGTKNIFAERFLPEIRTFSYKDAQVLKNRLQTTEKPATINGYPLNMPLYDLQQQKAIRVLDMLIENN